MCSIHLHALAHQLYNKRSQVEGKDGLKVLANKIKTGGPTTLFHGALAASAATFVGMWLLLPSICRTPAFSTPTTTTHTHHHRSLSLVFHGMCLILSSACCLLLYIQLCAYPCTPPPRPPAQYNYLNAALPQYDELPKRLMRSAVIGFCASFVSDCCSNSIRVVKTTKQTSKEVVSYPTAVKMVIEKDGVQGLFFRGLKTKILANGLQGLLFSVLWRLGQDYMNNHSSIGK